MKTADLQNEIFSIVDENDRVIGNATRGEVHKDKTLIHRSVGILVFNSHDELFFQKRSMSKDTYPGKWTISCSGHVGRTDNYETAAHRELIEELGLDLPIKFKYKFIYRDSRETEIVVIYKAYCDGPFTLQESEISEGRFIGQKQFANLQKAGEIETDPYGNVVLQKIGWI